jgi:methyl-accepting chemotaxis protein
MKVAIVGAGRGGMAILETLNNINDIEVCCMVDKNLQAPGMVRARELGINCTADVNLIPIDNVDIVIEVTGSKDVADMLRARFGNSCSILDSEAARLLTNIVEKTQETLVALNSQVKAINEADRRIASEIKCYC